MMQMQHQQAVAVQNESAMVSTLVQLEHSLASFANQKISEHVKLAQL